MAMRVLSVNVGMPRELCGSNGPVLSGIYKSPVAGRIPLLKGGFEGDGQADLKHHGGVYKAVYVYPYEHYAWWQDLLKRRDFAFGQFGENLTVEGMLESNVHIGDVFGIGMAEVEVTQPRQPCFKLGIRMGMPEFVKQMHESERCGYYLRVVRAGTIAADDPVELVKPGPEQLTVRFVNHLRHFDKDNLDGIERVLRIPALSPSWREDFEKLLAKSG